MTTENTSEINLAPSYDITFLDKVKALFRGNETVRVEKTDMYIMSDNPLSKGLVGYINELIDTEKNTHFKGDNKRLTIENATMWDGATIPDKKLGTLFLILGFFNPLWLILSWFCFVVFDGKKKFGKAGLWHDGIFQNGYLMIDDNKYWLSFTQANKVFYYLSIYYGKSKPVAFIAYIFVHLSLIVWQRYANARVLNY